MSDLSAMNSVVRSARKEIKMPNDQINSCNNVKSTRNRKKTPGRDKRGPTLLNSATNEHSQNRLVSNNILFKKLLYLMAIRKDEATVKQLFSEQGLEINADLIKAWTSNPPSSNFKPMPDEALVKFFDALFAIRNECKTQEINLFDLKDIFGDIRQPESKVA